jgi:catechol 2,3-dioxygenase-like lactoylglutathione lyase family enzyme
MAIELDHLILKANDLEASIGFYTGILGLSHEGERPPFSVIRVSPGFTLQLAPWGTEGGEHLAFAMTRAEFDETFRRIRAAGIAYGDSFHSVGEMNGPGEEGGARGMATSLYCFDPNRHLIEIRHYE